MAGQSRMRGRRARCAGCALVAGALMLGGAAGSAPSTQAARRARPLARPSGPGPTISWLSTRSGPSSGGTGVIIWGTGFVDVTAVRFGTVEARSFKVQTSTSISALSPAASTGPDMVTVTTAAGTSEPSRRTTFVFGAPLVSGLSVDTGSIAGGAALTVSGSGFALGDATVFTFGKGIAGAVECATSSECTMLVPPAAKPGAVNVRATVANKSSPRNPPGDRFTYG